MVQAILEQEYLFFILNYCNFRHSCYTENYNGQHLINRICTSPHSINQSFASLTIKKNPQTYLAVSNFKSFIIICFDLLMAHYFPLPPNVQAGLCFSRSLTQQLLFPFPVLTSTKPSVSPLLSVNTGFFTIKHQSHLLRKAISQVASSALWGFSIS